MRQLFLEVTGYSHEERKKTIYFGQMLFRVHCGHAGFLARQVDLPWNIRRFDKACQLFLGGHRLFA